MKKAIGLMSGTSMDGIDVALLETDGEFALWRGAFRSYGFDAPFRRRIERSLEPARSIAHREERPDGLATLEREITERHASAVRRFLGETGLSIGDVEVVGFHGQTVLHRPEKGLTVQLGDGPLLANALGTPVVYDMRAADMAAGGQGAPLAPAYHRALAKSLPPELADVGPVVFVNIGGISNVTYIDGENDPIAFDSGPGNALLDQWVASEAGIPFDQNGAIASEGGLIMSLAERYLASDFFGKSGPKSLDRRDFLPPAPGSGNLEDVARTLCFVTAEAILRAADHCPKEPRLWIVCGGGRRHPTIMADLRQGADPRGARAILAEEAGLDGDAMEAEAWAYLAVRSLAGCPLSWPSTTGCREPAKGGVLAVPEIRTAKLA